MGIGIAACFKDIRDTASGIWTEIQNLFAIFGRWLGNVFATDWSKISEHLGKYSILFERSQTDVEQCQEDF